MFDLLDDFFLSFNWNELDDILFGFNLLVEWEELVKLVSHCLNEDVWKHDELLKALKLVAEPEAAVDNGKWVVVGKH